MQFRKALRTQAKPLIGIYAESGCGKTFSSLVLARGFVGPQGKIGMIETESGRGEAYADPAEYPEIGGYDVLSLREEFSPETFGKAITAAEKAGIDALIIDSASTEWEGVGGVLDMAAQNQAKGWKGQIVWQKPKIDHAKHFMLRITQSPIPLVILCMRAKYPMEEVVKNGKKEWSRSTRLEPKQSEDILYEMFAHGWIDQDHKFHPTKLTGRGLDGVFPAGAPLSQETGSRLAQWAKSGPSTPAPASVTQKPSSSSAPVTPQPGGAEPLTPEEIDEAQKIARKGTKELQSWWEGLKATPGAQTRFKDQREDLKRLAEETDTFINSPL